MKLIHKINNQEVREGDKVTDFRGETGIVVGWTKPHNSASTGRITVEVKGIEHHCYPEVYFCEWINREDRLEEPQPTQVGGFEDFEPDWNELEVFPGAEHKPEYDLSRLDASIPSVSSFDRTKELMAEVEKQFEQIQKTLNEIKALLS